ncbi:GHMP kinase [Candidatus Aerophobetes bacterium]|nr:GHMP kinase [Candidatus Aerophobetes bacterium]
MQVASVKVPGSCGELVQGRIDGVSFHITCPVKIFSHIFAFSSNEGEKIDFPPGKVKAGAAVKKMLYFLNEETLSLSLRIYSKIPVGKGMASSTADIAGSCQAVANLFGKKIIPSEIARIAAEIEPTDGIMYKGVVCFDHIRGILIEELGYPPPMKILIIDRGGKVDTLSFNRRKDLHILHKVNEQLIKEAYTLVKEGIKRENPELVGVGATLSSLCNQIILYKPELYKIVCLSRKMGALGVNVAHSGTVMGILLPFDFSRIDKLEEKIKTVWGNHLKFYRTEIIAGVRGEEN